MSFVSGFLQSFSRAMLTPEQAKVEVKAIASFKVQCGSMQQRPHVQLQQVEACGIMRWHAATADAWVPVHTRAHTHKTGWVLYSSVGLL